MQAKARLPDLQLASRNTLGSSAEAGATAAKRLAVVHF